MGPGENGLRLSDLFTLPVLPVLSLSKEAYRRVRIEKPFEERIRIEKTIYGLERPFILRQAQHERRQMPSMCSDKSARTEIDAINAFRQNRYERR
jgi:hypothetical protein